MKLPRRVIVKKRMIDIDASSFQPTYRMDEPAILHSIETLNERICGIIEYPDGQLDYLPLEEMKIASPTSHIEIE